MLRRQHPHMKSSHLHQQRMCGPEVDDAPPHRGPVGSVAIVTVDGVQTTSCAGKHGEMGDQRRSENNNAIVCAPCHTKKRRKWNTAVRMSQ